jgi:uncharacterized protein
VRILISGAKGLVGHALVPFLSLQGHSVVRLTRKKEAGCVYWNPERQEFEKEDFEGFDAIIHLAGEPIASGRWSAAKKEALFLSRCRDSWLLRVF